MEIALGLEGELRARLVAYAARTLGAEHEAEDVVQEALLAAEEAGVDSPGWLYAVTYRRAIDRVRRRERDQRARSELEARAPAPAPECDPQRIAARRESRATLLARLEQVREPFRGALRLRYLESLSFPEVASRQLVPERTARSRVARGLALLRELLREEDAHD